MCHLARFRSKDGMIEPVSATILPGKEYRDDGRNRTEA